MNAEKQVVSIIYVSHSAPLKWATESPTCDGLSPKTLFVHSLDELKAFFIKNDSL